MSNLRRILEVLRELLEDASYDRYCAHLRRTGRADRVPTREAFYMDTLERRYSSPSRCC